MAAGREFFRLAFELLGHELRDRLARAVAERAYLGPSSSRAAAGGLSAICGADIVDSGGRVRDRTFVYTPRKFETLLELFGTVPTGAQFYVETWGERPETGGGLGMVPPYLQIEWLRSVTKWADPLPEWVLLYVTAPYEHLLGTPERQAAVLEFLERVAGPANPACGEVSYSPSNPFSSPLSKLLNRSERDAVRESRRTVRSYSWVTIIAEEIGQRLGGAAGLRDSGAFFRVEHLPGGGFLLQATEWFEQYQHEQAYRVFRVLAPALPPGVPEAPRVYLPEWNINLDDDPDFMIVQEDPTTVAAADQ